MDKGLAPPTEKRMLCEGCGRELHSSERHLWDPIKRLCRDCAGKCICHETTIGKSGCPVHGKHPAAIAYDAETGEPQALSERPNPITFPVKLPHPFTLQPFQALPKPCDSCAAYKLGGCEIASPIAGECAEYVEANPRQPIQVFMSSEVIPETIRICTEPAGQRAEIRNEAGELIATLETEHLGQWTDPPPRGLTEIDHRKLASLMKRRGKWRISKALIKDTEPEALKVLEDVVHPTKHELNPWAHTYDYEGHSEHFDEIEDGEEPPEYALWFHKGEDGITRFHYAERLDCPKCRSVNYAGDEEGNRCEDCGHYWQTKGKR